MPELNCPKCAVPMRSIERNGIVIERCTECGGIFLDRGELEHLTEAERAYTAGESRRYRDDDDDDDDDRSRRYDRQGQPLPAKKKRRGFLDELFDFG